MELREKEREKRVTESNQTQSVEVLWRLPLFLKMHGEFVDLR